MPKEMPSSALITAAGLSTRMGTGRKKELELIDGISVLARAIAAFIEAGCFSHVAVSYPTGERDAFERSLENHNSLNNILFVEGGNTRQESVFHALLALERFSPHYVLIHDGSRPWLTTPLVMRVLDGTKRYGACIPVVNPVDAPKRINAEGVIIDHLDKGEYTCAQTPQGFTFREIISAHRMARENNRMYPDDAQAYHAAIGPVHTVPGEPDNVKITYMRDLP